MDIISIDIGTYSIKVSKFKKERKHLVKLSSEEIILNEIILSQDPDISIENIQLDIINKYIEDDFQGKVIFQLPNNIITTRFLNIPVTKPKKIMQLIPFQLESNFPYGIEQIHYTSYIKKIDENKSHVTLTISPKEKFKNYYEKLKSRELIPSLLISELSAINSFLEGNEIKNAIMIIDLGYSSTKIYIANNGRIISNHVSHIAGKKIDTVLHETYNINLEEIIKYKHEKSFILTKQQIYKADENQKEFSKLMKNIFNPLIMDITRWYIGFKVSHGIQIEKIYLTGGTSKIKNLDNYFTNSLSIRTQYVDISKNIVGENSDNNKFFLSDNLATTQLSKNKIMSFMHGPFLGKPKDELPLFSIGFITIRTLVCSMIVIIAILINKNLFINKERKNLNREINSMLKKPVLNLSAKERRMFKRKPRIILNKINKKSKILNKDIKSIESTKSNNAILELYKLSSKTPKIKNVDLIYFKSKDKSGEAHFKGVNSNNIEKLFNSLKIINLKDTSIRYTKGSDTLVLNWNYKGKR